MPAMTPATSDVSSARTGKPREVQGLLNRLVYHPAARGLARMLALTPVTPNMVSVFGAAMVVFAGLFYTQVGGVWGIAAGFALHLLWHVVDGADGDLARMTGRASANGEMIDGICDYGGHLVLYLLLAASLDDLIGGWAWGFAVAAGLSRIVQSIYAESQRRTYLWWVYGIPWMRIAKPGGAASGSAAGLYVSAGEALSAGTIPIDRLVAAAQIDPVERARIAELTRHAGRRTLPWQIALGSNPRTVLLGCSMIAGGPLWFFLIEATVLNALLVASIVQQRRSCRRLAALIARGRA